MYSSTLQGFEHVFGDITCRVIDVKDLGFLVYGRYGEENGEACE